MNLKSSFIEEFLADLRRLFSKGYHKTMDPMEASAKSTDPEEVIDLQGKALGSSILRHSYLSHKYQGVDEEKKKDAALMMHSVETQGDYVKTED